MRMRLTWRAHEMFAVFVSISFIHNEIVDSIISVSLGTACHIFLRDSSLACVKWALSLGLWRAPLDVR